MPLTAARHTQLEFEERVHGVSVWAAGVPSIEAAVELLIRHGYGLQDEAFLQAATYGPEVHISFHA